MLEPIKEFTGSYVDDMSTFSFEFCEHMTHLRQYFEVVRISGLKLNLKKCVFAQCEVTYIGHIIGSEWVPPAQSRENQCHYEHVSAQNKEGTA